MAVVGAMIVALMMFFVAPTEASANPNNNNNQSTNNHDPGQVDVKINNGKLEVSGGGFTASSTASAWEDFINKYRNFIVGIAGIGAVTMIVLFIIQFLKLGASAGNPQARSQALVGCLWTGIAAAGLGAVTLIVGFFYNAFG